MLVAVDQKGQTINLLEKPEVKKGDYFCPACAGKVRYRSGKILRSHFAHQTLRDCDFWSENESAQHLSLKASLYQWLNGQAQVDLEAYLPATKQVADILVNQHLALEVQCSSLSISRLQERTMAYRQADMAVLWLLGKDLWLGERLTNLHKQFLYFSMNMGFHLWELDDEKKELRLRYLIHEDWRGKVHCLTKVFPFGQGDLLAMLRSPFAKQALSYFTCSVDQDLLDYVAKQLYYRVPKWMNLQAEAYQQGKNLLSQSLDDFYPQIRLPRSAIGFAQIKQDLTPIYQAFDLFYDKAKDKRKQILYPPIMYRQLV
ncbi:TPA: competence protein CoiA [Streptococcus suis]|nr:competence protein CoiA [Streptococcus suis]HEM4989661.1 competence protein CoiA [Streptococcus suis]HEM5207406.1 competence protein CoiA [Streptococcus suis]HEM5227029.1 competence protein CoiA [Streptococcus suis]HEM5229665.1 competence protein CoiA [Streptococcus suis]